MDQVKDIHWLNSMTGKDLAHAVAVFEQDVRDGRGPIRTYLLQNKVCIHGRTVFMECVYQGYLDAARRFAGIKDIPNYESFLFNLFADIEGCINYFTKDIATVQQYDEWHHKACMTIIQMMNTVGYHTITYGMAQKIVNMAMKYLYLVDKSAKDYLWSFCHMPLDSHTLGWYRKCIDSSQTTAWSKMGFEEYIRIQSNIRQYLASCSFCPLEVEYFVW